MSYALLACWVVAASGMTGCHDVSMGRASEPDSAAMHSRSIALESPALVRLTPDHQPGDSADWYTWRNDVRPMADGGVRSSIVDQAYTYTYDHQSTSTAGNNRVRDYYSQTTVRTRAVGGAR